MIKFLRVAVVFLLVFILVFDVFYSGSLFSSRTPFQRYITRESATLEWNRPFENSTLQPNSTSEPPTTPSTYLIDGMDRFDWYLKKASDLTLKKAPNISLLYAYEFEHEITVTLTSWQLQGFRVYCRYVAQNGSEIGKPEPSFTYPEYIVNCKKREGTVRIGLSVEEKGEFESLPMIDRMRKKPQYELSMCVATMYGPEAKWLMLIEMIEHFKLQGVQHFYLHIHNASIYDLKVVNDYIRTGELEVHYLLERDKRTDNHWHMVNIADCLIWSRMDSKWTIFADLDERILMTQYPGRIIDYLRDIKNETVGGIQFRQQWVLKTELLPDRYEGDAQIDQWMPTHKFHNSTGIGPKGHTAKCIIDSSKVFIMWVHDVSKFFPGHGYHLKQLEPEEGLVRHYRDQTLGNWGQKWLNSTLRFGPLRSTDYPAKYLGELTKNVKKRAHYVYGNKFD